MNIISFFITLQIILFFLMTFHDWVHLPPLTDIRVLEQHTSKRERLITSGIFALMILIPLFLTSIYQPVFPLWVLITLINFYGWLSLGTILSWWIPYLFGSSPEHKAGFAEYRTTHTFLPIRGNNVTPNTFHVIMHSLIWICFGITVYLLIRIMS